MGSNDIPAELLELQVGTRLAPTPSFIDRAIFLTREDRSGTNSQHAPSAPAMRRARM